MIDLTGKKIIVVCPKFYGYEKAISETLSKMGACVTVVFENLEWVSVHYRIVYAYLRDKKPQMEKKYYEKRLIKEVSNSDFIFVIRGSSLSIDIVKKARELAPSSCKFVLYQWDSVKNNPTAEKIAPFFDYIATFDFEDAQKRGWVYRPLFYITEYIDIKPKREFELLFFGSLHSNRAIILKKLKVICAEKQYRLKAFLYLNRFLYLKYKYIDKKPHVINAEDRDISLNPVSLPQSYKLYGDSIVVVDYTHPDQAGLTMRTIESLGSRCKLITNNRFVEQADFYDPDNVLVYDGEEVYIPDGFVKKPYKALPEDIYKKYSIEEWIGSLLGDIK